VDKILRILKGRSEKDEQAERSRRKMVAVKSEVVKKLVADEYRVTVEDIGKKGSHGNEARHAALWLASKVCIGAMSLKAVGAVFGVSASRALHVREGMEERMRKDRRLYRRLTTLLQKAINNA
jgi:chromosomal replication initiation ATPase DnaA